MFNVKQSDHGLNLGTIFGNVQFPAFSFLVSLECDYMTVPVSFLELLSNFQGFISADVVEAVNLRSSCPVR